MPDQRITIGTLAKEAGITPDSVRFYERSGLLPRPQRLPSGYRVYGPTAVRQLRFIKKAQALGFSLEEIKRIIRLCGQGTRACPDVISIAENKLGRIQKQIRELQAFADTLKTHLAEWRKEPSQQACLASEFCALIEQTDEDPPPGRRPKPR